MTDVSYHQALHEERLILDATEMLTELMEKEGVTRAELARRLHKSRSHVTQVLNNGNMTLRTLAEFAYVLGHQVTIKEME